MSLAEASQLMALRYWLEDIVIDVLALNVPVESEAAMELLKGLMAKELHVGEEAAASLHATLHSTFATVAYKALIIRPAPDDFVAALDALMGGSAKSWAILQPTGETPPAIYSAAMEVGLGRWKRAC
jgi:hypothetical protein